MTSFHPDSAYYFACEIIDLYQGLRVLNPVTGELFVSVGPDDLNAWDLFVY